MKGKPQKKLRQQLLGFCTSYVEGDSDVTQLTSSIERNEEVAKLLLLSLDEMDFEKFFAYDRESVSIEMELSAFKKELGEDDDYSLIDALGDMETYLFCLEEALNNETLVSTQTFIAKLCEQLGVEEDRHEEDFTKLVRNLAPPFPSSLHGWLISDFTPSLEKLFSKPPTEASEAPSEAPMSHKKRKATALLGEIAERHKSIRKKQKQIEKLLQENEYSQAEILKLVSSGTQ
jgi:hypothetical protein